MKHNYNSFEKTVRNEFRNHKPGRIGLFGETTSTGNIRRHLLRKLRKQYGLRIRSRYEIRRMTGK